MPRNLQFDRNIKNILFVTILEYHKYSRKRPIKVNSAIKWIGQIENKSPRFSYLHGYKNVGVIAFGAKPLISPTYANI
jgi:hypothetical protein